MTEFFTDENVESIFQGQQSSTAAHINFAPVIESIDFDEMFNRLLDLVLESPLGSMLTIVGGRQALEPLRFNFKAKMKVVITDMTKGEKFLSALEDNILPSHVSKEVIDKIEEIVDQRLDELTPHMV